MATIERFEEIKAWQDARTLVKRIYEHTGKGEFSRDFGLRDQIRRASISVMSNIAEGFERSTKKEFVRFLYIPKAQPGRFAHSSTPPPIWGT